MAAPTMTHVICTSALIILIFAMQFSYSYIVDNIQTEMARRELKEIADRISETFANLYFLANSTTGDVTLEKNINLPSNIRDSAYFIEIVFDRNKVAQNVNAYLRGRSLISATSPFLPGLKVNESQNQKIESGEKTVVAVCNRVSMNIYIWIRQA